MNETELKREVRDRYGRVAAEVSAGRASSGCCGGSSGCAAPGTDPITRELYSDAERSELPADAVAASLGCGNPTALAELRAGEVVLDLGSGGGIDVLLSARRVGPTGKAYGLDMTPQMLELARANAARAGARNVEFLEGSIESIPLPDASVDVIVSNCVINLSADKPRALREALRVLRPGGRFAVSDVVLRRALPEPVASSVALWTGCVAGALLESEYRRLLAAAGFVDIEIEPTRVYSEGDARELLAGGGCCGSPGDATDAALVRAVDGAVMSAFIRARRPSRG
ncbi:MAG: arsenite methyltransferase [Planctomycetota bacterium]|nr:MAG: arsenite methyltransferase [Planctomycetota bacterium]